MRRRGFKTTHYLRAVELAKEAKTHADAGKLEESRNLYKLAISHCVESKAEGSAKFREKLETAVAWLEQQLGIEKQPELPALARTEPEPDALETFYQGLDERRPIEKELAEKKGTG